MTKVICKDCQYHTENINNVHLCSSPNAKINNFVDGTKFCYENNKNGECYFFKWSSLQGNKCD